MLVLLIVPLALLFVFAVTTVWWLRANPDPGAVPGVGPYHTRITGHTPVFAAYAATAAVHSVSAHYGPNLIQVYRP